MAAGKTENRVQWAPVEQWDRDGTHSLLQPNDDQAREMNGVLIGQWYYYLWLHDQHIDLCRNQSVLRLSSFPEVVEHNQLAISDDDLLYAVQSQSNGTFEPGSYRISPVIERKLRILFE